MIQISADRQRARCVRSANERITTGLTGKAVTFRFGAGWENVTARTAVFEGSGVTKDRLIKNGEAVIPPECLTVPGGVLRCGVYGVEGDKKTPTVYAEIGQIERGADPSGDTSTDPTLAVWAQILAKMGSLDDLTTEARNTLVAAINEAANSGGGGGTVTEAEIEKALGYKPIGANDVPVKKVNGATGEVKSTFYVTVTPTGNGYAATADKTAAEVYAAYVAGYAVYAIAKFGSDNIPYMLPLAAAVSISGTVMLGFGALGSENPAERPKYLTAAYNGSTWSMWEGVLASIGDIPMALKNPYPLYIKIGNATTFYDGSVTKTVEITNDAPDVLLCTISGAGTSASPFTCDKTTAQIYEAAQAGKQVYVVTGGIFLPLSFADESISRFTKVTSTDTLNGMQGYATLVTVQSNGKVSVKQTGLEQISNRVDAISESSTNTQYPGAKAVWDAIPHPEAKTDAMTQAVGKDADGKLWTAPGGGSGGGGSAFSLIRSLTLTEQTDRVDITTGDSGSAFALTEVYVAVEAQSYTETAEAVIFLPNGLWTSNNPYITSSNKTTKASESWKSGMTFHAACLGNQMAFAEQCPTKGNNNNLESKIGTIGGAAITKISLVSKLTAGCTVTVYGR